jgi:hypothetical protein
MSCTFLLPWFYHSSNVWHESQIVKVLRAQLSPTPYYYYLLFLLLFLLAPNILPSTLFSNVHGLRCSLNAKDRTSRPYNTAKVIQPLSIKFPDWLISRLRWKLANSGKISSKGACYILSLGALWTKIDSSVYISLNVLDRREDKRI